ncbi:MAG: 2-amino-4-hydroxy-6-hydroxymethyldihydropteridine diphosphokinase [Nitrosomonas sp.]|nr:2-amino-4-hydroxy-6-hydroxymethyldihydropteridine diphosphokinase [Nitrosomonas sp.]
MPHSTKPLSHAYIALGSNLDDPIAHIRQACLDLNALPDTTLLKRSSLYKSAPVGQLDQPDFINAVVEIVTTLQPLRLLDELLGIEQRHGRIRDPQTALNAPRTLDLDILLYDNLQLKTINLVLPHPRMLQRAFVLLPLMEIAPDCEIPEHGEISQFIASCRDQIIEQLDILE